MPGRVSFCRDPLPKAFSGIVASCSLRVVAPRRIHVLSHARLALLPVEPAAQATERLRIAPLVQADAEAVRALTDDPAITGVVDFLPTPFTLDHARRLIGSGKR